MPQLELSRLHLAPQHLRLIQALLALHVPEASVWAYGSRVNGDSHEGSDLDLVLRFGEDSTQTRCSGGSSRQEIDGWLALKEAFEESSLPILVDVHLWSRLPESFHGNIQAAYVVLQEGVRVKELEQGQ